jgi:hypothetical protein
VWGEPQWIFVVDLCVVDLGFDVGRDSIEGVVGGVGVREGPAGAGGSVAGRRRCGDRTPREDE